MEIIIINEEHCDDEAIALSDMRRFTKWVVEMTVNLLLIINFGNIFESIPTNKCCKLSNQCTPCTTIFPAGTHVMQLFGILFSSRNNLLTTLTPTHQRISQSKYVVTKREETDYQGKKGARKEMLVFKTQTNLLRYPSNKTRASLVRRLMR